MSAKEFVTYATEYDQYTGHIDFNDLPIEQQDRLLLGALGFDESAGTAEFVMQCGWIKRQAEGISSLLVYSSSLFEHVGLVTEKWRGDKHQCNRVLSTISGTSLGKRFAEALDPPVAGTRTPISGEELEAVAQHGMHPSNLEDVLDMSFKDGRDFIAKQFSPLPQPLPESSPRKKCAEVRKSQPPRHTQPTSPAKTQAGWFSKIPVINKLVGRGTPAEVSDTRKAVLAILAENQGLTDDLVKKEIILLLKNTEKVIASIREDGFTSDKLAWILIFNVTNSMIVSGNYHTYRGMLSMKGTALYSLWGKALKASVVNGICSQVEADEDARNMRKIISEIG